MSLRKVSDTVTVDSTGAGSTTVHLIPSIATRHAQLVAVSLDRSSGFATRPSLLIEQLDQDDDGEYTSTGKQLFFTEEPVDGQMAVYSTDDYSTDGTALSGVGSVFVTSPYIRVTVDNADSGDSYDFDVYIQTAGDWRF